MHTCTHCSSTYDWESQSSWCPHDVMTVPPAEICTSLTGFIPESIEAFQNRCRVDFNKYQAANTRGQPGLTLWRRVIRRWRYFRANFCPKHGMVKIKHFIGDKQCFRCTECQFELDREFRLIVLRAEEATTW